MNGRSRVMGLLPAALCLLLAGIQQPAARAVTDTTPPTGTIVINNNRSATNINNVTLVLTWSDGTGSGVSRMRFSNDGATWSAWEPLAATRAHTLAGADGHKTVRVQYLDRANNRSLTYSDYIRLDKTAPTGTIVINGGALTTASQAVTLGLTWLDGAGTGVTRMRFSDNGSSWTPWETPKAERAHSIPLPNGYHTVRVQFLDGAGNYSAVFSDYIKLQLAPGATETVMLPGSVPMVMSWIPGGTFLMGSPDTDPYRSPNEEPQHSVTVGGFWMGKYEVTKRQWRAVMETTPWAGKNNVLADLDSPAVYVSWDDAQAFMTEVSSHTGLAVRLPSEAEWECACRAQTTTRYYWGDDTDRIAMPDYSWHWNNCSTEMYAHVVGLKLPNAWGLHDMSGNVAEWCQDWYHDSYAGAPADGSAWEETTGVEHVLRGGLWAGYGTSAYRYKGEYWNTASTFGFRVAR